VLALVHSAALVGVEAALVRVEVDVAERGLPVFSTVGLPDSAVRESRDRVRSAIKNAGLPFPDGRITVNLAPADLRKEGVSFDLPIALGLLAASGLLARERLASVLVAGELGLDGGIHPVRGVLSMALAAGAAGLSRCLLAPGNAAEAGLVAGLAAHPVTSLVEALQALDGTRPVPPVHVDAAALLRTAGPEELDVADVRGQAFAKRALEIAAAGGHNLLLVGPPGAGKSMLARRLPGLLPPLSLAEAIEVSRVWSVAGLLPREGLVRHRPFRAPHHTSSEAGLLGGGRVARPGEVSLAHRGVLFLDELSEFPPHALDTLRQPLEEGVVSVARATGRVSFPAGFQLVAAMNFCRRGCRSVEACACSPPERTRHLGRVSAPLLDRIDLHVEVPPVPFRELDGVPAGVPSARLRGRVEGARARQARRLGPGHPNARMSARQVARWCALPADARQLLAEAMDRLGFSARAHARILKVARTIADLEEAETVAADHVAEALQYRSLDRPRT
jgi:magnesium chelatase family protein